MLKRATRVIPLVTKRSLHVFKPSVLNSKYISKLKDSLTRISHQKRFNSANGGEDWESRRSFWSSVFSLWKNLFARYAIITGVVIGALWISWKVVSFFGALTFDEVGKWSFYAGF